MRREVTWSAFALNFGSLKCLLVALKNIWYRISEFIFFQKTVFGFPPLWLVAMRKIPLPFLFVCYSLLGILIFWWAKPARDLFHLLWTFKGHSCLSTAALQRSPFFAEIIPVTDLLYKFVILSHKHYVRNIIRNNIFCVPYTRYIWPISLITALGVLFFLSQE